LQSAKTNLNVEEVFFSIARDIKQRLAETDAKPQVGNLFSMARVYKLSFLFSNLCGACSCCLIAGTSN